MQHVGVEQEKIPLLEVKGLVGQHVKVIVAVKVPGAVKFIGQPVIGYMHIVPGPFKMAVADDLIIPLSFTLFCIALDALLRETDVMFPVGVFHQFTYIFVQRFQVVQLLR